MWFNWQPKPQNEVQELLELCGENEYRRVNAKDIPPGLIPSGLLEKCHDALVMCSGTPNGRLYFMINLNRIDHTEIDQMPYGIAYDGLELIQSGMLIQHGTYHSERTTPLPQDFHLCISESGLYPLPTMPSSDRGYLHDLLNPSHHAAFGKIVEKIAEAFPEGAEQQE